MFDACTEPRRLAKWWGPQGFSIPSVDVDLRVGGRYRIAMQPPDGELFRLSGEFRDVDRPRRLVYTFIWEEPDPDDRETLVDLELGDLGESTELALTQAPFATEARLALHREGWTESLDKLQRFLASQSSG